MRDPVIVSPRLSVCGRSHGFTLIELVVVMALTAMMMFVAIPSFQHILADNTRKTSQWILLQAPRLKSLAVSEMRTYSLHADLDDNCFWVSKEGMSEEELSLAKKQGLMLSDEVRIIDVLYADGNTIASGDADILFYPKGYSDKVIIHMESDDGDRTSYIVEPFLSQVEMEEGYIDFEG